MNKHTKVWQLQEAKAKFSELVRRTQSEGPQIVTVHGRAVVTITAVMPALPTGRKLTGADLFKALRTCPVPDFEIPERRTDFVVRDVDF
jgi:prevent-host-death family protein